LPLCSLSALSFCAHTIFLIYSALHFDHSEIFLGLHIVVCGLLLELDVTSASSPSSSSFFFFLFSFCFVFLSLFYCFSLFLSLASSLFLSLFVMTNISTQ